MWSYGEFETSILKLSGSTNTIRQFIVFLVLFKATLIINAKVIELCICWFHCVRLNTCNYIQHRL